jgi:hypothetical protein
MNCLPNWAGKKLDLLQIHRDNDSLTLWPLSRCAGKVIETDELRLPLLVIRDCFKTRFTSPTRQRG